MAREEVDRENLLEDATAYEQRIQWHFSHWDAPVFVGFRTSGAVSFYFGADPVYHFNAGGELRRLYLQGNLLKADQRKLVSMQRVRSDQQVALVSREMSQDEQQALCRSVLEQLQSLMTELTSGHAVPCGQVPATENIEARVLKWLRELGTIRVAASARV